MAVRPQWVGAARRWRNADEWQNDDWNTCRDRARGARGRPGDGCAGAGAERAVHPQPGVPNRRLRPERRSVRQWHRRLLHAHQRTRWRHQRRQDRIRGMRYRLCHHRGVERYERLKGKGPTGAAYVIPLSTGITFALTEKTTVDKIPIISMGYGRSESRDGSVFQWNFPLLGTYWTAADIILQHIAKKEGGFDKLKGK